MGGETIFIIAVPEIAPEVAVIVVDPTATPVATPVVLLIVAFAGVEDDQVDVTDTGFPVES